MHNIFPLDYRAETFVEVVPGLNTIMTAVKAALPGTDIMVRGGNYPELVKFPSHKGGTDIAPIRLISVDGHGVAKIIAPAGAAAAIQGLGVWNIAVIDIDASGGSVGAITFNLSGSAMLSANYCRRILVQDCIAHGTTGSADGIKISQTDDVQVIGNTVYNVGGQCIDYLAVGGTLSGICDNDLSGARSDGVIVIKGGSQAIEVSENYVHDSPGVHGISVGGSTGEQFFRPDLPRSEARLIALTHNRIERVGKTGKYAVDFLGGQYCVLVNNILDTRGIVTESIIGVSHGSSFLGIDQWSKEIVIGPNEYHVDPHCQKVVYNSSLPAINKATIIVS